MSMPSDPCRICGRTPTAQITLRRHVGLLIAQRFFKFKGPLCREHAEAMSKEYLTKTLIQGWWGIISFFVNFIAVATDLSSLAKARKIPEPQTRV